MTSEQVRELFTNKVTENRRLDYKRTVSKDDWREFLEDVVAFANTDGGSILIGIEEARDGNKSLDYPESLHKHGLVFAPFRASAVSAVRDSIFPAIPGLDFTETDMGNDETVIEVSVARSTLRPHMVDKEKRISSARRNSQGKQRMDARELKEAILNSDSVEQRFEQFVISRINKWSEHPHGWRYNTPAFVVYLAPQSVFEEPVQISTTRLKGLNGILSAAGQGFLALIPSHEGVEVFEQGQSGSCPSRYSAFYRNGCYEAGDRNWFFGGTPQLLPGPAIFSAIGLILAEGLNAYERLEIPGPFLVTGFALGTHGYHVSLPYGQTPGSIPIDRLRMPTHRFDGREDCEDIQYAFMDRFVQACGMWEYPRARP